MDVGYLMANMICKHCGRMVFEYIYGCKEPDRLCGLPPFDAEAYAHRYDGIKNSPEFIKRFQTDWDKVFGQE